MISPYAVGKRGYPRRRFNGQTTETHRAEWLEKVGPIPAGMVVRHSCDNPRCINLDHLLLGTKADNSRALDEPARAALARGHTATATEGGSMKTKIHWTLVQHSGYGYAGDPAFAKGLEIREVLTAKDRRRVVKAGGVVFDRYAEAVEAEEQWPYRHAAGLVPRAEGTFSPEKLDGLAIYVPVRELIG